MTRPKIHVLPNPSGITHERYRTDAFGIAASKFIRSMPEFGYDLVHYGHEASEVDCEHVTVITNNDFAAPDDAGAMLYHRQDLTDLYNQRVTPILQSRVRPGDIVASFYGLAHRECTSTLQPGVFVCEPSIGYPVDTVFAPFKAFVSHAWLHYYYGTQNKLMEPHWYNAVIPNAFDVSEFAFRPWKEKYFVYLGRMIHHKGLDLAIQVTEYLGVPLIIASSGRIADLGYTTTPAHVTEIGYVGQQERRALLAGAQCLMAPTYYIEPFGNIVVEAALSGTPVLTTDWGGFSENVVQGVTGYRCGDFAEFVQGARKIMAGSIRSLDCRHHAESNYELRVVHAKMHAWFSKIRRQNFYWVPEQ